jgi:peptide/nickel transport system permease protein
MTSMASPHAVTRYLRLLRRDLSATVAVAWLALVVLTALVGPALMGDVASQQQLQLSRLPPLSLDEGWAYVFGSDALGRSVLARLVVAARTTLLIAAGSVAAAATIGTLIGTVAGHVGGAVQTIAMRLADIILSFPSLLLALIMLYLFGSEPFVIVLVLGTTRIPVYLRTARAQAREVRELPYVEAAKALGLSGRRIITRHSLPAVLPTISTLVTLELGLVMLTESALTFLGIGVQPPDVTWGLMVADGRAYLETAWWLTFFPGMAISLTVLATNVVSNWARLVSDPKQRWRFETVAETAPSPVTTEGDDVPSATVPVPGAK